jgi:hypothetical protein
MRFRRLFLVLLLASPFAATDAQIFGAIQQDARPHVAGLQVRAMGGAVAAVPMAETAFFYNPAHLARLDLSKPRITFVGVGASVSNDLFAEYRFIRNELEPAIDEGLEEIRLEDYDRLVELYERALDLGSTQTAATLTAYGPSVQMRISDNEAIGVGLFGTNSFRMQFTDAGVGVPRLKGALLEELDADEEHLYVLKGNSMSFDVGIHAEDVMPNLDLGAAFYQVVGGGFNYSYDSRIDLTGNDGPNDEAEIAALEERFNARDSKPTYRIGAAYRIPIPPSAQAFVDGVTIATDYVSASTSEYDQPTGAHFRMGIGADIGRILSVQSGYSQGYPSFGASLNLPIVHLEYAYFGIEDGRTSGQLGRYNHHIQVRFGLF